MELRFFGATGGTTGSCHMLRVDARAILVDCGLFQGRRSESYRRNRGFPFEPGEVHAVVQTHAHIDHSGKLPMLVRDGFAGAIHATHGTRDLCEMMLLDSANIQMRDAEHLNKKRIRERLRKERKGGHTGERRGRLPRSEVRPLYLDEDVRETMPLFVAHRYHRWFQAAPGLRCRFHDAGHILGAAWVEMEASEGGRTTRLVFSGDYGRPQPILRDPEPFCDADVYVSESTYGDRTHPPIDGLERDLGDAVERLVQRGKGRLLIPVFAVGRAQNLIYTLGEVFEQRKLPSVQVVVDSPMATEATRIVARHKQYFDEAALERLDRFSGKGSPLHLRFTASVDESKALNDHPGPLILLSASGMMESGRILHHLVRSVGSPDTEILIVGYQARHTLGRRLLEGRREVNILGNPYPVRARVTPMLGFSAHADRDELLAALTPHARADRVLFLVHGENDQRRPLARELRARGFGRVEEPVDSRAWPLD